MAAPLIVAFAGDLLDAYLVASHARAGRRVVAVTADAGGDAQALGAAARALGADEHVVVDVSDHVWERYVAWLIKGGVTLGAGYPPWPTAERYAELDLLVAHARRQGAAEVAHAAGGDDRVLLETALRAVAPDLRLLDVPAAPLQARSWLDEQGLLDRLGAAGRRDLGGPEVRAGLWGTTARGGDLDDPWATPDDEAFPTVPAAGDAAALAEEFELEFTQGLPTSSCGAALEGPDLTRQVGKIARRHGVGRGVHLGEGALGVLGRVAYEAPAAAVLVRAHAELERLVLTRRQLATKEGLARTYGDLFQRGLFHEPLLRDLERFFESTQRVVTGAVRVRLQRGAVEVVGVRSPAGLAGPEAWAEAEAVDPRDAGGFARVVALSGRLARRRDERSREASAPVDRDDPPA